MFQAQVVECLLRRDSSRLVSVIQYEQLTSTTLTKLHQLVTKELCRCSFSRVMVVLKAVETLSESREDLETLLSLGLTAKVLQWFEGIHNLLTMERYKSTPTLHQLAEVLLDYFLLMGKASLPVSQLSGVVLELAQFVMDTDIYFPLRFEAIRTLNSILESLTPEQRRGIHNLPEILSQMASAVLTAGDYELQISLSEALCRLTPRKERPQRASQWFSRSDISGAFCGIRDRDFEVDCRHFLNFLNGRQGDVRRVYSFPCLSAFLDQAQLLPPKDDKMDTFWIDFNVGSGCVSFFVDEPEGFLWGTIHLLKEDVLHYSLQDKRDGCTGPEAVLSVRLNKPIRHHSIKGQTVQLSFSCEHQRQLEEAAGRVFVNMRSSTPVDDSGLAQSLSLIDDSGLGKSLSPVDDSGLVRSRYPLPADGSKGRAYRRKKSKSVLKVLPLLSPSSEDSCIVKKPAESPFDFIIHSTPTYRSGVLVRPEPESAQERTEAPGGSRSPLRQEVVSDRKRAADTGYLSNQSEGTFWKRMEPPPQWESPPAAADPLSFGIFPLSSSSHKTESDLNVPLTRSPGECSPGGAGPAAAEGAHLPLKSDTVQTPPHISAFKSFKAHLEQHFTGCLQNVNNALESLKASQQQVHSLLSTVQQHRLLLLNSISDQVSRLEDSLATDAEIMNFFQSQNQHAQSFCNQQLQRLKRGENPPGV